MTEGVVVMLLSEAKCWSFSGKGLLSFVVDVSQP